MNTRTLLLTVCIAACTVCSLPAASLPTANAKAATTTADTDNADFKTAVLDSYLNRCVEVLHSKGYNNDAIKAECSCELDYIDQQFELFELMLAGSATDNQQRINDFKKQLLQCKVKPQSADQ